MIQNFHPTCCNPQGLLFLVLVKQWQIFVSCYRESNRELLKVYSAVSKDESKARNHTGVKGSVLHLLLVRESNSFSCHAFHSLA